MDSNESALTAARFLEIFHSLDLEGDRGCVLVVGSLVESALESHLAAFLLPKIGTEDELMGRSGNRPISGFSAKINLAYRLGLIPLNERAIFHQLRELRNTCAHHIERQEFAANHFKDRTRNIIKQSEVVWEALRQTVACNVLPNNPPSTVEEFIEIVGWKAAFTMFFALVVAHKEACIGRVHRVNPIYEP